MIKDKPAYELIRSSRRTLALEVTTDCRVLVRAPMRASRRHIDEFVAGHTAWIEKHLNRQQSRRESRPEPTAQEREAYIRRAMAELPGNHGLGQRIPAHDKKFKHVV